MTLLDKKIKPDFEGLRNCILRKSTPERVYYIELFLDGLIKQKIIEKYDVIKDINPNVPYFDIKMEIAIQRFLGYDMVRVASAEIQFPVLFKQVNEIRKNQSATLTRNWIVDKGGMIKTWEDFENYPWPDPSTIDTRVLEWLEKNLPEDMAGYALTAHILEQPSWLMGYETLYTLIYEEPDLVNAVFEKCGEIFLEHAKFLAQFSRIGVLWGSDDMGFHTGTLLSPDMLRKLVLPWHRKSAEIAHQNKKLYLMHNCGNLEAIMEDCIEDIKIDAKHSFEDKILPVTEAKRRFGSRIGILGGIDVDFLCRNDENAIRKRVRETLDICQTGGGYCLGTGNTVADYIPFENYLVMLDEGRKYSGL